MPFHIPQEEEYKDYAVVMKGIVKQFPRVLANDHVDLYVKRGEIHAIVGENGAGKSTLLKILSRITEPTAGSVKIKGRVASLLEVGTGFHPELSGRENIFLNGAILGMKKEEIKRKFDEIVDFSGVEKFLDTPVKRYSSGMYVRLAFAVAAHLEPEILLIDEVLAVGDAEFQKKCLGKMDDVAKQGRTVLFVSHNMLAVKNLCGKSVWIENGQEKNFGMTELIIEEYLNNLSHENEKTNRSWELDQAPGTDKIKVKSSSIHYDNETLSVKTPFDIVTEFWCLEEGFPVNVSMHLYNSMGNIIFNISTDNVPLKKGIHKAIFHIPENLMNDGSYYVDNMFVSMSSAHFIHKTAVQFRVIEDRRNSGWHGKWQGAVRPTFIKNEYKFVEEI